MTEVVILGAMGLGALYLFHVINARQQAAKLPPYLGAPAWPTMSPIVVPEVGLPPGLDQETTYFGVSSTSLEPFLK